MKTTHNYRMELTEKQWQIIQKLLPQHKKGRKPIDRRKIINALFYLVRTGCQWRNLPKCFPKCSIVFYGLSIPCFGDGERPVFGKKFTTPCA